MEMDIENKTQKQASEQSETHERSISNYQNEYKSASRPQRPRIHAQRTYTAVRSSEAGGFRPEGFGTGLQQNNNGGGYQPRQQGGYRPRFNNTEGSQSGYQPRQQGGYRPRFNNTDGSQGGYQPRQQGGYRPRFNNNEGSQGGYQPRPQGGYRPRFNNTEGSQSGYQPRQQGGYRPRFNNTEGGQGGYQPRQQGGYRPRFNNNEGGQGGYQPRQQGGYRPRTGNYDPNAKYSMKKRIEYSETHIDPNEPLRLNKYLANAGVCSRREADEYIQAGEITVNGTVVTELGTKVLRSDEVKFHDKPVTLEKKVYVLLNKPKDCVTTSDDPQQRKTVMDIVGNVCPERIYPVGRLDRNTTGVLLLTNDGDLASKLTHPKFLKKKVYHVFLDKNVTASDMKQISEGIELEDGEIHADEIAYASDTDKSQVGIEIHSGKNRIVRRIFEHLGYRVVKLDRVQFAGLTKKNLRRGDWRFLTEKEVEMLRMGAFE
ncbi:MAG: pseudouridine synthase [Prevotella sp.]